jgi:hypothetical protein
MVFSTELMLGMTECYRVVFEGTHLGGDEPVKEMDREFLELAIRYLGIDYEGRTSAATIAVLTDIKRLIAGSTGEDGEINAPSRLLTCAYEMTVRWPRELVRLASLARCRLPAE